VWEGEDGRERDGGGAGWRERPAWDGGRRAGLQRPEHPAEATLPMGTVGGAFVPLLVGDQGERGGAVKQWLWEHHAQEEAHLHRAEQDRLGREQGLVVLQAQERERGVQPTRARHLVQGTE
jgi:hypothetical protein